jgi:tRNA modification GTPase
MLEVGATIVAPATGAVPAGVGILRVSGPLALPLCRPLAPQLPATVEPRRAYFTDLLDETGALLDQGLFLYFAAPHSFTGEDVVELHTHGSPRLLELLARAVLSDGRARPAAAGEFTRRAYLNGRIDLSRAEAVAELVSARSEAAVRAAAAQLRGALSQKVCALRAPVLALHTDLEGVLNFPDEAEGAEGALLARLEPLAASARALVAEAGGGRLLRRGARVVLYGPVNAGKSTLFNRLLGEERALVDEEPGTTRDVLEAQVEWDGVAVTLVDTAGLREAPGRLEGLGMQRARRALGEADLAVLVLPSDAPPHSPEPWQAEAAQTPLQVVWSKADLRAAGSPALPAGLHVSGLTGEGVPKLRTRLVAALWGGGVPDALCTVSERHADALGRALGALERGLEAARVSTLEVVSGELGLCLEALGEITGESAGADLLDAIFRRFCIGK